MKEQYNAKYIKISDLTKQYGISRYSVYDMVKNGKIDAVKIGNKLLIDVASLDNYFKANKVQPTDDLTDTE